MSTLAFTIMLVVALGIFGRTMYRRTAVLLKGTPDARFDDIGQRIWNVLVYAFGQKKFVQPEPRPTTRISEQTAGWMHFFIFWGFTILAIQVIQMFVRGFVDDFYLFPFTPHLLGGPYLLAKDIMEVLVLFSIGVALYRWGISHPARLYGYKPSEERLAGQSHWEAYLILCFIGTIMISGKLYDGGRMIFEANNPDVQAEMAWQPFSRLVGIGLNALGGAELARLASNAGWWIHNAIILIFLNLLPLSKHFHILTFLPNVFFAKTAPKGQLSKQDLETATRFGTSYINQFTWKQVLDMYSCTECGRCASHCPATISGKELAPRQLLLNLRDYLYEHENDMLALEAPANGNGSAEAEAPLIGENIVGEKLIHDEVLWACTTCRACEEACPIMIEYVDKIVDMRRHLVQEESRFPAELTRTFKGMETQSNPWGVDAMQRDAWAEGLDIPTFADKPDAEYLYYVGCAGSFDDRAKRTTQAVAKILKQANVDFAILGKEEMCNGETARRIGNEYLFQSMAQMCNEVMQTYNVKKILTNCPHCFNTLKNEFPQFGGNYDVVHATEFVRQLITDGKVEFQLDGKRNITYHDSCYLGRYNEVYDAPRDVLTLIPGITVKEPERNRKFGMCCGAGGGRMWMEEEPDKRVNIRRVEQLLETEPDAVAVACPYCMTMIDDGLKAKGMEEKVQAVDVMELVADSMK
ncbi:MAG TPA: (Fe-S)-binding protein [Terriglobales bacterium]|nr:(Fe-S)-binding protein [Terriglobales bacterium]